MPGKLSKPRLFLFSQAEMMPFFQMIGCFIIQIMTRFLTSPWWRWSRRRKFLKWRVWLLSSVQSEYRSLQSEPAQGIRKPSYCRPVAPPPSLTSHLWLCLSRIFILSPHFNIKFKRNKNLQFVKFFNILHGFDQFPVIIKQVSGS